MECQNFLYLNEIYILMFSTYNNIILYLLVLYLLITYEGLLKDIIYLGLQFPVQKNNCLSPIRYNMNITHLKTN